MFGSSCTIRSIASYVVELRPSKNKICFAKSHRQRTSTAQRRQEMIGSIDVISQKTRNKLIVILIEGL